MNNSYDIIPCNINPFKKTYTTCWKDVYNYTDYHIQVECNVSCEFKIYQTNDNTDTDETITPTIKIFNYTPEKHTSIISGNIKCKYIKFSITPINNQESNFLKFSIIYKPNTNTKNYGTFWNKKYVEINEASSSINSSDCSTTLCIFGNANASTTLTLQFGIPTNIPSEYNYYSSQYTINVNGDFGYTLNCPFYSVRLISSQNAIITAYCVSS